MNIKGGVRAGNIREIEFDECFSFPFNNNKTTRDRKQNRRVKLFSLPPSQNCDSQTITTRPGLLTGECVSAHGTQHTKALHCYLDIGNLAGADDTEEHMQNPTKDTKPDKEKKPAQGKKNLVPQHQEGQEQKQIPFKLLILRNDGPEQD
ncbi:hypothetical protein Q4520_21095 [Alteromonas sp. 1_MG-2023]|uniref:hypothetical protein n=1 Tax=Alteromonas sp. 1_MG-2023 TaxID=3062669 RepID=UPI0026E36177|nr:hypothetical protein [Alteromonas sp. 1_MG-2023]MDO6477922.1 hypothetical protein [Alteromonas sp. 1_MG-2023]